jgi:mono/diheme cytochrome c family protein
MLNIIFHCKNALRGFALSALLLAGGGVHAVTPGLTQAKDGVAEVATEVVTPSATTAQQTSNQQSAAATPIAEAITAPTSAATPDVIKQAKRVYASACARCHGVNLVNTGASTFDLRTFPPDQKSRFVQSVLHGKGAMPAWQGSVTPEEVEALWAYISAR